MINRYGLAILGLVVGLAIGYGFATDWKFKKMKQVPPDQTGNPGGQGGSGAAEAQ